MLLLFATDSSHANSKKINTSKMKEMLVAYHNPVPHLPTILGNGVSLERVSSWTLVGIELINKLPWDNHVEKMHKKASQSLHFLPQLRWTKMSSQELVKVYASLIRLILEYVYQLWHPGDVGCTVVPREHKFETENIIKFFSSETNFYWWLLSKWHGNICQQMYKIW